MRPSSPSVPESSKQFLSPSDTTPRARAKSINRHDFGDEPAYEPRRSLSVSSKHKDILEPITSQNEHEHSHGTIARLHSSNPNLAEIQAEAVKPESMDMHQIASQTSLYDYRQNFDQARLQRKNIPDDCLGCGIRVPVPPEHISRLGLGSRGIARVWAAKATRENHGIEDNVAVKLLKFRDEKEKHHAKTEVEHLLMLCHNHITAYLGHHYTPGPMIGIIMFPVAAWDLDTFLETPFETPRDQKRTQMMRPWFRCLAKVLLYLHDRDDPLKHRDIKPANILIDRSGAIFLTDFGISKVYASADKAISRGDGRYTIMYASQAMIKKEEHGLEVDVFALCCVFLEMLTVMLGKTLEDMILFILKRSDNPERTEVSYSTDLKSVIAWAKDLESTTIDSNYEKLLASKGVPMIIRILSECADPKSSKEASSVALLNEICQTMDEIYPNSCKSCDAEPAVKNKAHSPSPALLSPANIPGSSISTPSEASRLLLERARAERANVEQDNSDTVDISITVPMLPTDTARNSRELFANQTENLSNSVIGRTSGLPQANRDSKPEAENTPTESRIPGHPKAHTSPTHRDTTTSTNSVIRMIDCTHRPARVFSYDSVSHVPGKEVLMYDKAAKTYRARPKSEVPLFKGILWRLPRGVFGRYRTPEGYFRPWQNLSLVKNFKRICGRSMLTLFIEGRKTRPQLHAFIAQPDGGIVPHVPKPTKRKGLRGDSKEN